MNNKTAFFAAPLLALGLQALSGCATTAKFEPYDLTGAGVTKLHLITDCLMLDDGSDTQTLDAPYNLDVCSRLSDKLAELLERQTHIQVDNRIVSTGLQAGGNIDIPSSHAADQPLQLPLITGNTHLSPEQLAHLSTVSANLSKQLLNPMQAQDYLAAQVAARHDNIQALALAENEVVMLVQLVGLKADTDTQNMQIAVAMLSAGMATHISRSAISATAIILDKDGVTRWADAYPYINELHSDCKVHKVKSDLLSRFPLAGLDNESKANTRECYEGDPRGFSYGSGQ